MLRWSPVFALVGLIACGYTASSARPDGQVRRLHVAPIVDPALHLDTGALVEEAVRQAIAREAGVLLVAEPDAEEVLQVELLSGAAGLEAFAQPDRRAAQYRATVLVRGILKGRGGQVEWTSPVVSGDSAYLSTPGALESLDGAERRGLDRAAQQAAGRLVLALVSHLRSSRSTP
ncbi:MAG: hypothetical protein IPG45_37675 [Deltaproteobacteria bacterium]|jgi:hypothetical protein|nr:hypothetical protein [Deltaproteobacteria bacterium]